MKLEDQVVSLEIAKQLKEAGYEQEGLFRYYPLFDENGFSGKYLLLYEKETGASKRRSVVAPTVAELGEALPDNCNFKRHEDIHDCLHWKCLYTTEITHYIERATTEADARALLWLELKEEGLL